ncbi:MAG: hypothetical protein GY780_03300 [bacterium]|nr:hypothetical protein [bacterium]
MVLFVGGVFGGADVYAAGPQMHNGGEGDPDDGWDIVSGGGGSSDGESEYESVWDQINAGYNPFNESVFLYNPIDLNFQLFPIIENGEVVWVFSSSSLERGGK